MEHPLAASEVTHELWSEHVKREWPHGCLPCTYTERDGLLGVARLVVVHTEPKASGKELNIEGDKPGKLRRG